jgi:antitoxin VapB
VALNIKHPEADRLARDLARRRRQGITEAVVHALRAELAREAQRVRAPGMAEELLTIGKRYTALPTYHGRSDDQILGYDEHGLPV